MSLVRVWTCEEVSEDSMNFEFNDHFKCLEIEIQGGDDEQLSFIARKSGTVLEIIDQLYEIYQAMREEEDKS